MENGNINKNNENRDIFFSAFGRNPSSKSLILGNDQRNNGLELSAYSHPYVCSISRNSKRVGDSVDVSIEVSLYNKSTCLYKEKFPDTIFSDEGWFMNSTVQELIMEHDFYKTIIKYSNAYYESYMETNNPDCIEDKPKFNDIAEEFYGEL